MFDGLAVIIALWVAYGLDPGEVSPENVSAVLSSPEFAVLRRLLFRMTQSI